MIVHYKDVESSQRARLGYFVPNLPVKSTCRHGDVSVFLSYWQGVPSAFIGSAYGDALHLYVGYRQKAVSFLTARGYGVKIQST